MMYRILIICLALLFACGKNSTSPDGGFWVKVIDNNLEPVEGVAIKGGFDWEEFHEITNSSGKAYLPGFAKGDYARIFKNNYFTEYIDKIYPVTYVLEPTPKKLVEIGTVEGDVVKFTSTMIQTVTYQGDYRVYSFNDETPVEVTNYELPQQVKSFKLYGDTLWYNTHENDMFVYLLQNYDNPLQLYHFEVGGYITTFARKDSILAVINSSNIALKVFSLSADSALEEITSFECLSGNAMKFISNCLIITGNTRQQPVIYDFSDLNNIELIYNRDDIIPHKSFMYGDSLILVPSTIQYISGRVKHHVMDLSTPSNPIFSNSHVWADGYLLNISNSNQAFGRYYNHYYSFAVFEGYRYDYNAVAIVVSNWHTEFQGGQPPYYIIGNKLWKLVDR